MGDFLRSCIRWVNPRNPGDLNGDGTADILIGDYTGHSGESGQGAAYLIYDLTGTAGGTYNVEDSEAIIRGEPGDIDSGDWLGYHVVHLGDIDGDGFGDIMVDYQYEDWYAMFRGPLSGEISRVDADANLMSGHAQCPWVPPYGGTDINGDGFDDLIMTMTWYVLVYWGPVGEGYIDDAEIDVTFESGKDRRVTDGAPGGDMNADGVQDIIVSSLESGTGRRSDTVYSWVISGPMEGYLTEADAEVEAKICSGVVDSSLEVFISKGEDLDGEGTPDILLTQTAMYPGDSNIWLISGEDL